MRFFKYSIAASVMLLLGACAASPHKHDNLAVYISKPALESMEFPAAPAPGTPEDQADFSALHDWQTRRTADQCAEARKEGNALLEDFFGDMKPFKSGLPRESRKFIMRYREDLSTAVEIFKVRNARRRPFHSDASLDPCIGRIGGLAYPSGHATLSRAFALLLGEISPARKGEFLQRADEAALSRVIGGVHHPSDIEAGKRLAETLFPLFMDNPVFREQVDKLRPYAAD